MEFWILPICTLWFISIYTIGYFIVFRKWDKKYRAEASSCLMSLAHGNAALILSILSLYKSQSKFEEFAAPNTALQRAVLEHSIAYFSVDLLHYLLFIPTDALFIVHHLATLYVLATCRYLFGHGAAAVLGVLALAESTAACQNTWSLARYRRLDSDEAAALFDSLSPYFYGYYTAVRGVLGPLFTFKIGFFFMGLDLDGVNVIVIPRWGWVSWIAVIAVGIGLSVLWVLHLWLDLFNEQKLKNNKKKKMS